jgi:hypothetical protein
MMVPNFLGTEFRVYNHQKTTAMPMSITTSMTMTTREKTNKNGHSIDGKEATYLVYDTNVLGRMPNAVTVIIPRERPNIKDRGNPTISDRVKSIQKCRRVIDWTQALSYSPQDVLSRLRTLRMHTRVNTNMPELEMQKMEQMALSEVPQGITSKNRRHSTSDCFMPYGAIEQEDSADLLFLNV